MILGCLGGRFSKSFNPLDCGGFGKNLPEFGAGDSKERRLTAAPFVQRGGDNP